MKNLKYFTISGVIGFITVIIIYILSHSLEKSVPMKMYGLLMLTPFIATLPLLINCKYKLFFRLIWMYIVLYGVLGFFTTEMGSDNFGGFSLVLCCSWAVMGYGILEIRRTEFREKE